MTDLLHTIPDFPINLYTHLLPSLERNLITTTDLLTLDVLEIAKRAQLPLLDVRRLVNDIVGRLQGQLGLTQTGNHEEHVRNLRSSGNEVLEKWSTISIIDASFDEALGGGIPAGYITEVTGESGTGKTQLLLTLLLSAQLPPPHGLSRPPLYMSTEPPLPTTRLRQLLTTHPLLSTHPSPPSLSQILTLQTPDLESQEHILTYQLPVALTRHNIGLCIIDSIAANYRAERPEGHLSNSPSALAQRSVQLVRLGALLRSLARKHNCVFVVANQVSDRFPTPTLNPSHVPPSSPISATPTLSLDHQQRFFTGWGWHPSSSPANLKTPSLGLVWANQIACRIALTKQLDYEREGETFNVISTTRDEDTAESAAWSSTRTKRWMRVVFAPWVQGTKEGDRGVEFEIWAGGVRAIGAEALQTEPER